MFNLKARVVMVASLAHGKVVGGCFGLVSQEFKSGFSADNPELGRGVLFICSDGQLTAPLELSQQKHTGANEQVLGDTGAELGLQGGGWEGGESPPAPAEDGNVHWLNFSPNSDSHPLLARCGGRQMRRRPRAHQALCPDSSVFHSVGL